MFYARWARKIRERAGLAKRERDSTEANPIFTISPGRKARLDSSRAGSSAKVCPLTAAKAADPQT